MELSEVRHYLVPIFRRLQFERLSLVPLAFETIRLSFLTTLCLGVLYWLFPYYTIDSADRHIFLADTSIVLFSLWTSINRYEQRICQSLLSQLDTCCERVITHKEVVRPKNLILRRFLINKKAISFVETYRVGEWVWFVWAKDLTPSASHLGLAHAVEEVSSE